MGDGATDPPHGPRLHLVESLPASAQGVECASDDPACGVPVNTEIRLQLDRPLLPRTAVRQSIRVYTGTPNNVTPLLTPTYDVLTRELVYRFAGTLVPKTLYQVELPIPEAAGDFGLRAFDGAPLEEGLAPLVWSFMTAGAGGRAEVPAVPDDPGCDAIVALLSASCGGGCCHGDDPAMGLRLESAEDLRRTAIDRVAHQSETGNTAGLPAESPARFGVAMPIIDAGAAHNSYLLYKLLLHPGNLAPCSEGCGPLAAFPGADRCEPLSAAEARRLGEWFVQGEPMPLERGEVRDGACRNVAAPRQLDCGSLRALARFIDAGARCP